MSRWTVSKSGKSLRPVRGYLVAASIAMGLGPAPSTLWAQWQPGSAGAIFYNGGNVGIGTMAPGVGLDVQTSVAGQFGARIWNGQNGGNGLWIRSTWPNAISESLAVTGYNDAPVLTVMGNSGNVGIGTNSPAVALDVQTSVAGQFGARVGNGQNGGNGLWVRTSWPGTNTQSLSVTGYQDAPLLTVMGSSGHVGVGTANPQYPLSVNGTIQAKEVLVNTGWSDYVFEPGFPLQPLTEVAAFIRENHHLPDMPSAAEVKDKGVNVGEVEAKLLAKVEELTLRMIAADQRNDLLEKQNRELAEQNAAIQKKVARLEAQMMASDLNDKR